MSALAPYRKSIVAAVLAFVSVVLTAWSTSGSVSASVWVGAAAAAVGSLQVAWLIPNADADPLTRIVAEQVKAKTVDTLTAYADRLSEQGKHAADPAPVSAATASDPFALP